MRAVESVWDITEQYTMRYSKGHRDETAARILDHASMRIREQGLESITVATLMKMAGLTHGGFYLHFESREELIDQAFAKAMESSVEVWRRSDRADGGQCLASIVEFYLAERHRLDVGNGCALPALTSDVPRSTPAIRSAFVAGIEEMIGILAGQMCGSKQEQRRDAIATLSVMVGALMLARATGHTPHLSDEILNAGRHAALQKERIRPSAANRTRRRKSSASRGRKSRLPA
jgi:TetR/AcrR family transcriptional regulator, transcriptional repressor for nem operon